MTTPSDRRRDPQPISQGWEIVAASIGAGLLVFAMAALAGIGVASAVLGGGWVWPHGTATIGHVIGGLLTGHPGRGLPPSQRNLVASPAAVYGCVAAVELLAIALASCAGVLISRYRRPNDARSGMASRSEANRVLGVGQLRAAKEIIRPDVYGRTSRLARASLPRGVSSTAVCPSTTQPVPPRAAPRSDDAAQQLDRPHAPLAKEHHGQHLD